MMWGRFREWICRRFPWLLGCRAVPKPNPPGTVSNVIVEFAD